MLMLFCLQEVRKVLVDEKLVKVRLVRLQYVITQSLACIPSLSLSLFLSPLTHSHTHTHTHSHTHTLFSGISMDKSVVDNLEV